MRDTDPYRTPEANVEEISLRAEVRKKYVFLSVFLMLVTPWVTRAINSYVYERSAGQEVEFLQKVMLLVFVFTPIISSFVYCCAYDGIRKRVFRFFGWLLPSSVLWVFYVGILISVSK